MALELAPGSLVTKVIKEQLMDKEIQIPGIEPGLIGDEPRFHRTMLQMYPGKGKQKGNSKEDQQK